jgi:hypothetical protein
MLHNTASHEESPYLLLAEANDLFSIVSNVTSGTLFLLILSYLNSVSLAKECVLLNIYQDVLLSWVSINCIWVIKIILYYNTGNGIGLEENTAKVLCFVFWSLITIFLLQVNLAFAIKFYMTKTMILDPPIPWGYDEKSAMLGIRVIFIGLTLGLIITLYGLGMYPHAYYEIFLGQDVSLLTLPRATLIYPTVLVSLLVNCTILCIATNCYRTKNAQPIDAIIPEQITYSFGIFVILIGTIMFTGTVDIILGLRKRWILLQLLLSFTQVITSAVAIFNAENLKSHSIKVIKDKLDEAFFLSIYLTPTILALVIYSTLYLLYEFLDV